MHLLFGFSGRIGRGEWWLAQLAALLIIVLAIIGIYSMSPDHLRGGLHDGMPVGGIVAIGALAILLTWINIASTVKRFHDRNKSGFWFFITFVPYIGGIWQLVECGCLAGTPGSNEYGSRVAGHRASLDDYDIEAVRPARRNPVVKESFRPAAAVAVSAPAPRRASAGFGKRTY